MSTRRRKERGFVLVCVLWVLAIMTVITLGLGKRALLEARSAAYTLDYSEAMLMARGAVQRGIVELRNKAMKDSLVRYQGQPVPPHTHLGQDWANPKDMLNQGDYFDLSGEENYEDDVCYYYIEDNERWININAGRFELLEGVEVLNRSVRRRIKTRLTRGLSDDDEEAQGPQVFHAIEELRYMRGVDEEMWFGEDEDPGLNQLLTTRGRGRININTASPEVLRCIPGLKDNPTLIDDLLMDRAGPDGELNTSDDQGYATLEDFAGLHAVEGEIMGLVRSYCSVNSSFFTITGIATRRAGKVRAYCKAVVEIRGGAARIIEWREEPLGA